MKIDKHNGIISIWKFLFSLMVVILHCDFLAPSKNQIILRGGSIAVEFFFITSGYLMAVSAFKRSNKKNIISDTWSFIWKKVKTLFPYVLIAFISVTIVTIVFTSHNIYDWLLSIWNLIFLEMTGIKSTPINPLTWYLSAMLLSMLIIYPLLRKYKKNYSTLIAPIIVIFLAGYMCHQYGHLRTPVKWIGFCYKGLLRAFLELNIGVIVYEMTMRFKKLDFTKFGRVFITILEVSCFSIIFIIAQFLVKGTRLDFIMLVIFSVGIMLAFSEKSYFYNFCCNKFFYYLEKLSLSIYVNHLAFVYILQYAECFSVVSYPIKVLICVISSIIFSMFTLKLVELWQKQEGKVVHFLKDKIIVSNKQRNEA